MPENAVRIFSLKDPPSDFALFTYSNAGSYNILAPRKITPKRKKIQIIPMSEKAPNVDFYLKRRKKERERKAILRRAFRSTII